MKLPSTTSGHRAEEVTISNQNGRRRRLFDALFEGTKEGALANLAGHMPHIPGTADGVGEHVEEGLGSEGVQRMDGEFGALRLEEPDGSPDGPVGAAPV